MKRYFQLDLQADAIMPSHYGTVNFGPDLDYVPGTMFLGVAAAKLYQSLNQEDQALAYLVFHGGALRFGNGLPLGPNGQPTFPMPLCWHEDKNGEPAGARRTRASSTVAYCGRVTVSAWNWRIGAIMPMTPAGGNCWICRAIPSCGWAGPPARGWAP